MGSADCLFWSASSGGTAGPSCCRRHGTSGTRRIRSWPYSDPRDGDHWISGHIDGYSHRHDQYDRTSGTVRRLEIILQMTSSRYLLP